MINLKSPDEIEIMKKGGEILSEVLRETIGQIKPGITLKKIDQIAENLIISKGAEPSFNKVPGYKWTTCLCVNDVVVHGIPNDYIIKEGDVVGVDCGVFYKGFHTDSAWSIQVKPKDMLVEKFLKTGEKALNEAVKQAKLGNRIYDISKAIQEVVEKQGYSVVETLVGHGVGKSLHEDPEVPGLVRVVREKTPELVSGLVIAIEVIYNIGSSDVVYKGNDGWTIATKDGKISGLFETTVAFSHHGCIVLTPYQSEKN